LLFQSFLRLKSVNPGFNPGGLLVSRLDLLSERYDQRSARLLFYRRATERISALSGVQSAALSTTVPFDEMQLGFEFVIEGRPKPLPSQYPSAGYNSITPDYFRTMGIRLLAGRHFTDADREDSPAAVIINKAMASCFWPVKSPIGHRIRLVSDESVADPSTLEIVGVVENVRQQGLDADVRSEIYLPYAQRPWRSCFLLVRSESEAGQLAASLRHEIREIDPNVALSRLQSMNQYLAASIDAPRFRTFLLTIFAVLALLLAAVGIYGVTSYSVAQRTRDFGIRLALAAQPRHLLKMVAGREFLVVLAGIGLGTVFSAALTQYLSSLLFGVAPHDVLTFAAVAALCGSVALAACYIPSRRVMEVDPLAALRDE
jgi:putative ABC transport system permease protein